jgi:hypothetical protein
MTEIDDTLAPFVKTESKNITQRTLAKELRRIAQCCF